MNNSEKYLTSHAFHIVIIMATLLSTHTQEHTHTHTRMHWLTKFIFVMFFY